MVRPLSLFDAPAQAAAVRESTSEYPCWVRVELVREAAAAYRPQMHSPEDVAAFLRPILAREPREVFVVICLDAKHRVLALHRLAYGTVDSVPVDVRAVFQLALLANAVAILVAHNHPSGDPTPSPQDFAVTERLRGAGRVLDIEVLDHLVLGDEQCVSAIHGKVDGAAEEVPAGPQKRRRKP